MVHWQSASSLTESANSEPQSACNVLNISVNDRKDNCTVSVHLGSECSMTQTETSKDPGKFWCSITISFLDAGSHEQYFHGKIYASLVSGTEA
ncbi:hypothetical protein Ddye_031106 [Dipteronia dyeriana]|uniref:Uncharacterized protein n=1 Tax=Dipteronia dyeriana TaxID=168575 RepID=A0AAD9WM30_9ROSI|nr:hypothetical protein Ddye_031106 [Dipteronia dyeriana]